MRVPIGDYPFTQEDRDAINRVMDSGRISENREVRAFEDEFADYLGVKHCVAVSSGTSALIVGMKAMQELGYLKPLDVVLIPALTFVATANAVVLSGLSVRFADVERYTFCMDPLAEMIRADLILPVHLMGNTAHMTTINTRAKANGSYVAEDAAEAHGSRHFGSLAGSMSLWSAFSFYIAHTVQAGELGAICTDDADIASACRSLKAHGRLCTCRVCTRSQGKCPRAGQNPRFTSQYIGYNFKPMEFQAALARVQLSRLEENILRRKEAERSITFRLSSLFYDELIEDHYFRTGAFINVPMAYPIVLKKKGIRSRVMSELESAGIECRPLFNCIPTQMPSYKGHEQALDRFPVSEYYGHNAFYVGCHQYLSNEQIAHMTTSIVDVVERISNE